MTEEEAPFGNAASPIRYPEPNTAGWGGSPIVIVSSKTGKTYTYKDSFLESHTHAVIRSKVKFLSSTNAPFSTLTLIIFSFLNPTTSRKRESSQKPSSPPRSLRRRHSRLNSQRPPSPPPPKPRVPRPFPSWHLESLCLNSVLTHVPPSTERLLLFSTRCVT